MDRPVYTPGNASSTHAYIAAAGAREACDPPAVEAHLSNVFFRAAFRHKSYVSPAVAGMIRGFGVKGHERAQEALCGMTAVPITS